MPAVSMRIEKDLQIDAVTRQAWDDNWQNVSIERILEIFDYPRVRKQLDIYKKYLPKDKNILEGGCGLGPYLIHLIKAGYNVIGIDYNWAPLKKIIDFDKRLPVFCADVLHTPFADSFFGGYLSLGVIEHFTDGPNLAIKEANRILEPGGHFIVCVPRASIFYKMKLPISKLIRRLFNRNKRPHYWEQYFGISELAVVLKKNGFKILEIIPIDHEHGLLSFCNFFRDKSSYDGANRLGVALGGICQKYMPWSTAAEMVIVARKKR